jgi:hypothetical protein
LASAETDRFRCGQLSVLNLTQDRHFLLWLGVG